MAFLRSVFQILITMYIDDTDDMLIQVSSDQEGCETQHRLKWKPLVDLDIKSVAKKS